MKFRAGADDNRVLLGLWRPSPRLPRRTLSPARRVAFVTIPYVALGLALLAWRPPLETASPARAAARPVAPGPHLVFLASPPAPHAGGGGGGGGNGRAGVIPRAQAPGRDAITLPVARAREIAAHPSEIERPAQALLLDARPLAAGTSYVAGLPDATAPPIGDAQGPGSGGGVGDGIGTGVGSGRGPGVGQGTGGGTGGGVYRAGGAVTAPVLLHQVRPGYTAEALQFRVQGTVMLELIVNRDGVPDQIRVTRSLDPGGLDQEAIDAVRQWRFRPGRLGETPVDVLIHVIVDFNVR